MSPKELPGFVWDETSQRYYKARPGAWEQDAARQRRRWEAPRHKMRSSSSSREPAAGEGSSKAGSYPKPPKNKEKRKRGKRVVRQSTAGPLGVAAKAALPQAKLGGFISLLRARETGAVQARQSMQACIHEGMAASLVKTSFVGDSHRASCATAIAPVTMLCQAQLNTGTRLVPSILYGTSPSSHVAQICFPSPGDNACGNEECPIHMSPGWYRTSVSSVARVCQGSSQPTSISPWSAQKGAPQSMVGVSWLGGGAIQGGFTLYGVHCAERDSATGVGQPADARSSGLPISSAFRSCACVQVRLPQGQLRVALGTSIGSLVYNMEEGREGATRPMSVLSSHGSDVLTQVYCGTGCHILRGLRNGWVNHIDTRQPYRGPRCSSNFRMTSSVAAVAALPLQQHVFVTASVNGQISLWDIRNQRECLRFEGHANSFTRFNLAVSEPDGALLAAGGSDNAVRIWSTRSGRLLRRVDGFAGNLPWCSFSPESWGDAAVLWCGGESGIWTLGPPEQSPMA